MKKILKIVGWTVGCIVTLLVVVFLLAMWIAPCFIRDYVNENSEELAGQKLYIGDLSFNLFALSADVDSLVIYKPETQKVFLTVDHLNVNLEWLPLFAKRVDAKVALQLVEGGSLNGHVDYLIEEEDFDVNFSLSHFNLHTVLPYLQESMTATDMQGLLDAKMHVAGNVEDIFAMKVKGQSCVSKFLLSDTSGEPCFQADSLSLATSEVNLLNNRYGFSYVLLKNPDIHVVMSKDTIDNISAMFIDAPIDQISDSLALSVDSTLCEDSIQIGEEPFDLYIDKMAVTGGKLAYTDHSLAYDPFVYEVTNIDFEADTFRLGGINNIAVTCQPGSGDGCIDLDYRGSFDDLYNMVVNLRVKDLALKDFSPYVVEMFGNPLIDGTLSFDSDTKVTNGDLDSHNHLIINNPKVDDKRKDVKPEIKGVPVKAGIYVLTDKNGICDMEVPVTGNIDEPKFSVKRLIFRTLGKLIVKVASAPFGGGSSSENNAASAPTDSLKVAPVQTESIQVTNDTIPQI